MKIGKYTNLILTAIVWSLFLASQGYANQTFSSYTTGVFMFGIAGVLLLITVFAKKQAKRLLNVKGVLWLLILVGAIAFLANMCSFYAYKHGDPQTGTFLLKIDVLMVCMGSIVIYKEKFNLTDILCAFSMFLGVLLVLEIDFATMSFRITDIFFVLSALCISINSFLIAHMLKRSNGQLDSYSIAIYNAGVGLVLFSVMMIISGDVATIANGLAKPDVLIALIGIGVSQYLIYITYYRALSEVPVWLVKVVLLLIPILNMILTYFIYGTIPSAMSMLGGAIVLISGCVILLNQEKKKQEIKTHM